MLGNKIFNECHVVTRGLGDSSLRKMSNWRSQWLVEKSVPDGEVKF